MGRPHPARTSLRADDSGFTLVEAVVALFVLGVVFTALALASVGALRASWSSRLAQQGVDFATQGLESARQLGYGSLAHTAADLAGDPRVTTCGANLCFRVNGVDEVLVVTTAGSVNPHRKQVSAAASNNVPMTVSTYVTDPVETDADYKRVTVITSWTVGGLAKERVVSSLVTETTRGLPLPIFKLTPLGDTSATVNPGADAVFGFELVNQGAPDRWNLQMSGSGVSDWTLYRDDGDGLWGGATAESPLTNTNSPIDTLVDTDRVDPTGSVTFWAARKVSSVQPAGDYRSTLTATSAAQPSAATATASVDLLVRVTTGVVTGGAGGGGVATTPGAPLNLQLTTGDGQLVAAWQPPASQGSSPITDYVISYKLAGVAMPWTTFADGVATATTATITGLVNGFTYDVSVAAKNSAGIGAQAATATGKPQGAVSYTAPTRCPAGSPPPAGIADPGGYTLRRYALHNRSAANPTWPGAGIPAATSTAGQGLPLVAAVDGPQVPAGTNLPVYSSDIDAAVAGRIMLAGGALTSSTTTKVVDWRGTVASKAYKGEAVLEMWVAAVPGDDTSKSWSISAQPYYRQADGTLVALASETKVDGSAGTLGPAGCNGWQQVWMKWSINQNLKANEFIGVRAWVPTVSGALPRLRVAYDVVGDFPAGFTVPEK